MCFNIDLYIYVSFIYMYHFVQVVSLCETSELFPQSLHTVNINQILFLQNLVGVKVKNPSADSSDYCVVFFPIGTHTSGFVVYFPRVERVLALLCYTFPLMERVLAWPWYIFPGGFRSCVIVLYFPLVERALALLCYIFPMWIVLWRYCVVFSAGGTCSGVIVLYFPRLERALALLCYIFLAWNAL